MDEPAPLPRPDPATRVVARPADERAESDEVSPRRPSDDAAPRVGHAHRDWRRAVAIGLTTYAVSRICVLIGAAVRASQRTVDAREAGLAEPSTQDSVAELLTSWDGLWYLAVAREGYPTAIPADVTIDDLEARAAFFPMYPGAIRLADSVLPGGDTLAALGLNLALGGLAVLLVGLLAREIADTSVALRAMVVFAVFPGSFILSWAYAESLMIVFAGCCLLFLHDRRWLLAGLAAALTTATHPMGIAVVAACVVAAGLAIRRDGDWTALFAPLLAPIGVLGFLLYVDAVADEGGAWFRVRTDAWGVRLDDGWSTIRSVGDVVTDPLGSPTAALTVASAIVIVVMAWGSWRVRLPWEWLAYSAAVALLALWPDTMALRPRFVLAAFPLFIGLAAWWPTAPATSARAEIVESSWTLMILLCGAGLVGLTGLYGALGVIP